MEVDGGLVVGCGRALWWTALSSPRRVYMFDKLCLYNFVSLMPQS